MKRELLYRIWRRLRQPMAPRRRRQSGIALMVVAVTIAVLGAVVGDFAFNTRVDLEAAANARDQLRAEYLARSGMQLARLLIKVQQSVLDRNRQFIGDVQIADFAPYLMKAFGGAADERAGLGALLGIDTSQLKGLGVGQGATFDVTMASDDGRINVNCGGGLNDSARQQPLYGVLRALFWPPRYALPPYNIFGSLDSDGQLIQPELTAKAIIDWADSDEQAFVPTVQPTANGTAGTPSPTPTPPVSTGPEDYLYNAFHDPYKAHNNFYDTVEEMNLVRGVGDAFWGSFGEMFTVYGGCKVNVGAIPPERWPIVAALVRYAAKDPENPLLGDDIQVAALSQKILGMAQMFGGISDLNLFIKMISDPAKAIADMLKTSAPPTQSMGIPLDPAKAAQVMTVGERRIYRLDAVGTIQRTREKKIEVHIRGIWDSKHVNQNIISNDSNDKMGTWVYWRQD